MLHQIVAINPGSTSTKIALYSGESMVFTETIDHSPEELDKFNSIVDQLDPVARISGMAGIERSRAVDIIADDEGPFSPERAERVTCKKLIDAC